MTNAETAALFAAAALVINAGLTFDDASSYVANGAAFAFSVESAHGSSASGPAAFAVVSVATGAATLNNHAV
tara:strand:+ start:1163 stop:1378 length:216 start_codon:yes stop_codon:yes gene_type:complete